jgi:hypothetical protein
MLKNIRKLNAKFNITSVEKCLGGKELVLVQEIGSIFQKNTA